VGSVAVRFRPDGTVRERGLPRHCEGPPLRREAGHWIGKIDLHGEDGYFAVSTGAVPGVLERRFRLRCRVAKPLPQQPTVSLRERIEPELGYSLGSLLFGSISSLTAGAKEDGREVVFRATHAIGRGPGAEVEAEAFEYQGRTPVGRFVQILDSPPRSLITSLPGEHPASAVLKPGAPFSGEARYRWVSPTDHSLTGSLAVAFPGLRAPLTGPQFFSTLCVISPLKKPLGCDYESPSWQNGEESATGEALR
jgi:hypothetical protein